MTTKTTTVDFRFAVAGCEDYEVEQLQVEYEWSFCDFLQRSIPRILNVDWGCLGKPDYPPAYNSAMVTIEDAIMEIEAEMEEA